MRDRQPELKPWMPFALPAAIAVPILAGFMLGGPPAGFFVAAVAAVTIVAVAVLLGEPPPSGDDAWVAAASRRMLAPLAIALAGVALVVFAAGSVRVVGWGVLAVAGVVAVAL